MTENCEHAQTHHVFRECQNVTKQIKKSRVLKRVNTCHKSMEYGRHTCQKHVKTCPNISNTYRLLVTGHWLLVMNYWLTAIGY